MQFPFTRLSICHHHSLYFAVIMISEGLNFNLQGNSGLIYFPWEVSAIFQEIFLKKLMK